VIAVRQTVVRDLGKRRSGGGGEKTQRDMDLIREVVFVVETRFDRRVN